MKIIIFILFGLSFLLSSVHVRGQSSEVDTLKVHSDEYDLLDRLYEMFPSNHPDSLIVSQEGFNSETPINLMDLIDTDHKPYYLKNAQPFLLPNSTGPLPVLLLPNSFGDEPALFCRIEKQLESKSKLAPRFRLGSLNYTNWMEGKGEMYSRYWK